MKEFTKQNLRELRDGLDAALKQLGEKFGVSLKLGTGRFSPTNCTFKLEAAVIAEDGQVVTKESQDFTRLAKVYGLSPEDLGRTFKTGGKSFTIVGLNSKRPKYPINAKSADGKTYKFSSTGVILALQAARAS